MMVSLLSCKNSIACILSHMSEGCKESSFPRRKTIFFFIAKLQADTSVSGFGLSNHEWPRY